MRGAADAAAGVTFTGTYEVTTPSGDVLASSFEVLDGDTWVSGEPALPETGAGALIGALALIMAGATMVAMRRRRQY